VGARGRAGPGGQLQRHRAGVFWALPATIIIRARVLYISASKIKKIADILIFFKKKRKYHAIPLFVFYSPLCSTQEYAQQPGHEHRVILSSWTFTSLYA
jgi:hypothetical protein